MKQFKLDFMADKKLLRILETQNGNGPAALSQLTKAEVKQLIEQLTAALGEMQDL
jgi:hypothetical protein